MAGDLIQTASWPGVIGTEACSYTCSHGITPGTAILTTIPQANGTDAPDLYGNLTIGDGYRRIVLQDCRVDRITSTTDERGTTWTMEILDRRWRWRTAAAAYGMVRGWYNRQDPHGKLIPWTIRSPEELARLCLDAMGEVGYVIDLPKGLSRADGADLNRYLRAGENFRQSFANPEQVWDYTPPAVALAALCDYFGCRVVFQPFANRVLVTPLGVGNNEPGNLPCESVSPVIDPPETPKAVGVAGAPTQFQGRFLLQAVGEEWDGKYVPIDDLSYAPRSNPQRQITTVTGPPEAADDGVQVTVSWTDATGASRFIMAHATGGTLNDQLTSIQSDLGDQPGAENFTFGVSGDVLTIRGRENGFSFGVAAVPVLAADNRLTVATTQSATRGGGSWQTCMPPEFTAVVATDRLSYMEALALARKSVFRCFRLVLADPYAGAVAPGAALGLPIPAPLVVPGYGPIKRRQQIHLLPTKVEQVVPQPRIAGGINAGNPLGGIVGGILPEYYNGYSRSQQAVVFGKACAFLPGLSVLWNPRPVEVVDGNDVVLKRRSLNEQTNTDPWDRVFVPFDIAYAPSGDQLVVFSDYVYEWIPTDSRGGYIGAPRLVVETACHVRDADTDQFVRGEWTMKLGGSAPIEWATRDDVVRDYIGRYGLTSFNRENPINNEFHLLTGTDVYNEDDAKARADYYLKGMARKYQLKGGGSKHYVGIYPLDPDGKIQQVTWSVGGGASTAASVNTEYSAAVPPYPKRRLAENLAPNADAAASNEREYAGLKDALAKATAPPSPIK